MKNASNESTSKNQGQAHKSVADKTSSAKGTQSKTKEHAEKRSSSK